MKKNILFVYNNYSTFVQKDFEILSLKHSVKKYHFKPRKGLAGLQELTKQFFYFILNIWRFDHVFIWFADYHAFFPVLFAKMLGKKSLVVIGGYDVANIPELKYGSLSKPLRKKLTLFVFRNANICLPVVESLEKTLKELCPIARTETIHTGYREIPSKYGQTNQDREKIVLTVSMTSTRQRMLVKGLDRLKELAEKLHDFEFWIIGVHESAQDLFEPVPPNLSLFPPLNEEDLTEHYCRASFYAQFSRSEGLPNSLCEAMLCGCIPMGLRIGGIPAAIDDLGFIIDDWDCESAIDFIRKNHNRLNRELPKKYILKTFNLDYRAEKLLEKI